METPIKRRLLTDVEASIYLNMSLAFLRQSRMEGRRSNRSPGPPFIRTAGRSVRYDLEDLDRWIAENRIELG